MFKHDSLALQRRSLFDLYGLPLVESTSGTSSSFITNLESLSVLG